MRTEITNNGYMKVLDNGYRISVIGGKGFYGDGKSSFEVGVWIEEDKLITDIKVNGWMSYEETEELITMLNKFK